MIIKRRKLGLALLVLSGGTGLALSLAGVHLVSAEGRNLSSSPSDIAFSGHVSFHWPAFVLLVFAAVGLLLLLSSNRGSSHA